MSLLVPKFDESVIVRDAEAEVVGRAPTTVKLLADSSATGGALSTQRVTLTSGADGAKPHWHDNSAEMFFLLADADLLIVITPGVERFAYFRHLQRIALGEVGPERLLAVQELYDNHFTKSAVWDARA